MVKGCAGGAAASRDCLVSATATDGRVRQIQGSPAREHPTLTQEPSLRSIKDRTFSGAPEAWERFYSAGNR